MNMPGPNSYVILIEGDAHSANHSAFSPDLPGCVTTGPTIPDTTANMREAITLHLDGIIKDGDPVPKSTGPGVFIEATAAGAQAA